MTQKILFAILFIAVSCKVDNLRSGELLYRLSTAHGDVPTITPIVNVGYGMSTSQENEEEDLPFDNTTVGGYIMNWVATLLLWFIYLMAAILILGGTLWSLTAKSFWSTQLSTTFSISRLIFGKRSSSKFCSHSTPKLVFSPT